MAKTKTAAKSADKATDTEPQTEQAAPTAEVTIGDGDDKQEFTVADPDVIGKLASHAAASVLGDPEAKGHGGNPDFPRVLTEEEAEADNAEYAKRFG